MYMNKKLIIPSIFWWLAFSSGIAQPITIDTVFVGDPGNLPQSASNRNHSVGDGDGFGQVNYSYHIGTYPVTNGQYAAFLNDVAGSDPHGLWNSQMGSTFHGGISRSGSSGNYTYGIREGEFGYNGGQSMANMPVNFVSFWDAARFTNWLTTGDTETGVYNLGNVTNPTNNSITRDAMAWANGGVAIASENEWFKAAYYNPATETYALYATGSDSLPAAIPPNSDNPNSVNRYGSISTGALSSVSPVGSYTVADSAYGTFDQTGNVVEWNDAIYNADERGVRGGGFSTTVAYNLQSAAGYSSFPTTEYSYYGFRVASLSEIPEPSTYAAIFGLLGLGFVLWRRKARNTAS